MIGEGDALFFKGGKAWDLIEKIPVQVVGKNEDKVLSVCQEPNRVAARWAFAFGALLAILPIFLVIRMPETLKRSDVT